MVDCITTDRMSSESSLKFVNRGAWAKSTYFVGTGGKSLPILSKVISKAEHEQRRIYAINRAYKDYRQDKVEYKYRTLDAVKFVYKPKDFQLDCISGANSVHRRLLSSINTDEIILLDPYFMKDATAKLKTIDNRIDLQLRYKRAWEGLKSNIISENRERQTVRNVNKRKNKSSTRNKLPDKYSGETHLTNDTLLERRKSVVSSIGGKNMGMANKRAFSYDGMCDVLNLPGSFESTSNSIDKLFLESRHKLLLIDQFKNTYTLNPAEMETKKPRSRFSIMSIRKSFRSLL